MIKKKKNMETDFGGGGREYKALKGLEQKIKGN